VATLRRIEIEVKNGAAKGGAGMTVKKSSEDVSGEHWALSVT